MDKNILTNRFCGVFVCAIMLFVAQAFAAWDGTSKVQPTKEGDYYIIDTEAKLAWYAKNYNSGNAKLTADMDLGGHLWIPIAPGDGSAKYSKTFDGNSHVIKNMYINGTELAQIDKKYAQNLGFIAVLGGGTVKNLILENVDIQAATNAGDILGREDSQISVGPFVGWMNENGANKILDCVAASGTIRTTGKGQGVGGIVGNAKNGTISNCLSLVEIHTSGADAYIGGIIGITKTDVTVSSCVYAGPGLVNTGTNGLTGGVVGNVYTGKITTENNYFEGGGSAGVGGSICTKNCNKPPLDSASFNKANTNAQKADVTNIEKVVCAMNGKNADGSCKEEPWSLGQTGLSLNGYGADGYKIIFNANGGAFAGSAVTKNIYLASGMAITDNEVGKPSRDGFSFEGWAATADATESLENLGTVSKSTKFYAVWAPLNTIIFNVAPGSFSLGEQSKTKQVANGEVITVEGLGALPTARCKKYVSGTEDECETWSYFTGWALTEGALESDSVSLDAVTASDSLVLYAVWTDVETYTVTYNANQHGRTTVDYVRVGAGDTVTAPTDPIADSGYEFAGWFTDAEGENPYQFAAQIHESIILYAKWALDTFTVAYEMNGVSNAGENPVFYTIETPTFALAAPADSEGYVFEGWFYDANFTNPASQLIQGTTGDKTFYAKWTKKTYRIMYLADNNSQGSVTDQFKEHGTPITLESAGYFNRKGYAQTGWATDTNGAKVYDFGASYEDDAPLTLYPAWSDPIVYTITYVCEGCVNDPKNPETYTVLTSTGIKYASSAPEGYRFAGWFSDKQFTKKVTKIESGTIGDLTLYGKLNKIYKITYVGTDKPYCDALYTVDDAITLRNPADSAGYTFGGWFTNANFEGDAVTGIAKGSEGDTTFYAKWNKNYPFLVGNYGAVKIYEYSEETVVAKIDGNSDEAMNIPTADNVSVNQVVFDRDFSGGLKSTVMFPFTVSLNDVSGGEFFEFKAMEYSSEMQKWTFRVKVPDDNELKANKPYIFVADQNSSNITFNLSKAVSLSTEEMNPSVNNRWIFKGSYEKVVLNESHPDWTYGYGYSAEDKNGLTKGKFFRFKTSGFDEATLLPMRAYLVYDKSLALTKSRDAYDNAPDSFPDLVDVEIVGQKGIVVGGGMLNTKTGELKMDRWYDLSGRRLNGKPTTKGTYYYNGKRIIVR